MDRQIISQGRPATPFLAAVPTLYEATEDEQRAWVERTVAEFAVLPAGQRFAAEQGLVKRIRGSERTFLIVTDTKRVALPKPAMEEALRRIQAS
jgi:hypothetical protein